VNSKRITPKIDSQFLHPLDRRWLEYVKLKPDATIFHHPTWLNLLKECYGYRPFIFALCDTTGEIKAGLPVIEIRNLSRRRWVSLPFSDYCPPLFDDPESLAQITNDLTTLYQTGVVPNIEVRWDLPPHPLIQSNVSYYLHTLKLDSDPQLVHRNFKRTHRQNISTAEERGVRIEWGREPNDLSHFYSMQLETRRRKGVPVQPRKFFELIGKEILGQGLGFILLAYKDNRCLAGGLFLHWQQTLTYKYAASSGEDQECRPNNLLSWIAMRWGCENGYSVFDLGRSEPENSGLRRFKCGWGAEESPLIYSSLSGKPAGNHNGKLKSIMGSVIRKSPSWVCRMTGEILYRYIS
jgi:CelD/BcsL family acetyltransferase involved in cellulose biosynthesis